MKVTCIIPSLIAVDREYLKLCVESLRYSGFDGEIVAVTNGTPTPEPLPEIQGITKRLHTRDQGQCNAVNIGAQGVHGGYLFIVNADMYFPVGWNKNLRFDHLVFSPNLIEPINNAGSAPPFVKADAGYTLDEFDPGAVVEAMNAENHRLIKMNKEESGFNFPVFIRKDVWDTIGGYDRAFDPWGSNGDTDLQTKINLAGITPKRLRNVLVYHFSNKSGTFDGTHQEYYQHNLEYFKQKWGFSRDDVPGCDVWYNKNILPRDPEQIRYRTSWMGKYRD